MKRREFVQYTSLAGGAFFLSPELLHLNLVNAPRISVQLYSVRDDMNANPIETIAKLAQIGYREIEGFGYNEGKMFGMPADAFNKVVNDAGVKMSTVHFNVGLTSWDSSTNQLTDLAKQTIAAFAKMDVEMVICPFIVKAQRDHESVKKLCNVFNRTGELCRQHGMKFGYHNHEFEFVTTGSETIYDIILKSTNPKLVEMQLDLYWAVYAGKSPVDLIRSAPGRFTSLHVKDIAVSRQSAEVGEGSINFAEIFALEEAKSVKYYIVELEHYKTTPLKGVEVSFQNLKKILSA